MSLTKVIYGPGSQVKSENLDDIQDEIIANEVRIVVLETPVSRTFQEHASAMAGVVNCQWQNITSRYWESNAAPAELTMPITLEAGSSLTAWSVDIRDTASAVTAQLFKAQANIAPTALGAAQVSAGSTSDQTLSHTLGTAEVILTGTYYFVRVDMPAIAMRVYGGSFARTL